MKGRIDALKAAGTDLSKPVPVDLVTSSGSGLDPEISPAAAAYQIERVAKARGLAPNEVEALVDRYTSARQFGVLLSFLSVAAFDFFFVPPRLSLSVSDTQYLLTFFGMLLTSLVISHLTSSLRREARVARRREQRTGAMYAMARELAAALTTEQIVGIGSRHVGEVFGARVAILLPDSADQVKQKIEDPDAAITLEGDHLDTDVGQWVYDHQKPAGHGTDTLPAAALYLPLKAPMRSRGVLAVVLRDERELNAPEQQRMLDAFAAQIALALERVHYVDIARDALVSMESERLRNSLLSAISHDLRTPLTTIVGFSSMLAQSREQSGDTRRDDELVEAIHEEALRMTGIVTNLLDMVCLQAGSLQLNRQWTLLEETVGAALRACRRVLAGHPVQVDLAADLPLLHLDAVLMERLFSNLFENAAKYTAPGTPITIGAQRFDADGKSFVRVTVDDNGPGLPAGRHGNARVREVHARRERVGEARHRPWSRNLPRDRGSARRQHRCCESYAGFRGGRRSASRVPRGRRAFLVYAAGGNAARRVGRPGCIGGRNRRQSVCEPALPSAGQTRP
ncbi:MAG: Osmosensitive K+ channel histidine kinase KdpD [uncultured Paraburkholderia sp.]|nr:MAG: Osmosensitive K+ channel histidine kinase KdpD [uncultured Paraburkholderia sp.]